MLTNFWKSYLLSCNKTFDDLGNMLIVLCHATMFLHAFYFTLNWFVGGTEEIWFRIAAVTALTPSLATKIIPRQWLSAILASGLIISGPLFMLTIVSIELTKPEIDLNYVILREYEYLAAIALCLVSFSKPMTIAVLNLVFLAFATALIIPNSHLSTKDLPLVLLPFLSLWFPVVFAGMYFLEKKSLLLARKAEALSTISSSIAHELRTPLAGIQNYATRQKKNISKAIRENSKGTSDLTDHELKNILATPEKIMVLTRQANTIIDMLLIASKDYEESASRSDEISANKLVLSGISSFPFNNDHEQNLIQFIPTTDFFVVGPETQLVHVILNLMKNAIRFSQRNRSRQVEISVDAITRSISVIDDGPGISPQAKRRIFDRFYTTEKYGQGTGIGLSFCKMTMESIGGSIECESVLGEYTKFTLKFP